MTNRSPSSSSEPLRRRDLRRALSRLELLFLVVMVSAAALLGWALFRRSAASVGEGSSPVAQPSPDPSAFPEHGGQASGRSAAIPDGVAPADDAGQVGLPGAPSRGVTAVAAALPGPDTVPAAGPLAELQAALARGDIALEQIEPLLKRLAPAEMATAWQSLSKLPWSPERDALQHALMTQWAVEDPVAALAYAETEITSSRLQRRAAKAVMETWAESDPTGAYAWYTENYGSNPLARRMDIAKVMANAYRLDPEKTIEDLFALPNNYAKRKALLAIFMDEENPAAGVNDLLALYGRTDDDEGRATVAEALALQWAHTDPAATADWIAGLADPVARETATRALAGYWSRVAPEEAMAWLDELTDPQLRLPITERVVRSWARDDPDAVLDWIDEETLGSEVRDSALASAAGGLRRRDPVRAMSAAERIVDEKTRTRTMDSVARTWMRTDREAAVIYVLNSDLPNEIKRRYAQRAIRK